MGRAPCCDKANVKRGPWSPEEDATLKSYLEKHGTAGNWIALPSKAGLKRCGKSCRLRWLNYLRPDIKHGGFTEEEDNIICTLYSSMGSRWSLIASQLPGRTDNDVKNYWNTKLKKKLLAGKNGATRSNYSNNINDATINNTSDPNMAQFSVSIPKVEPSNPGNSPCFDANPSTLPPLMDVGYQQYCDPQGLILDGQFSLASLMEVPSGCNSYSLSSSHEVSSLSTPSSLALESNYSPWSSTGSIVQQDGCLLDFGFESSYELLHGFDFQEKSSEGAPPYLGSPPFTS